MAQEKLQEEKRLRDKVQVVLMHLDSSFDFEFSYYNMGLLSMATILRDRGYRVRCLGIHQLHFMTESRIKKLFLMDRPAIAGFYTVSDNIYQVEDYAERIKKWSPGTKVVVGGPLATSLGAEMLNCPHFDICVVGEGEEPMKSMAEVFADKKGCLSEIPGIIYREKGKIAVNPPSPPIPDLDALPFPDHSLAGIQKIFHVVSGRGCPYNCIFCFQGVHGLKYRHRSAKSVTDEIVFNLESHPYKAFDIIDDTFISSPARVTEVARSLSDYRQKTGRDFIFFCQGRVDIIDKHPWMLEQLQNAGLARLQVGLEAGHQKVLDIYHKKIDHGQTRRIVDKLNDIRGMCIIGNFILGGPFEDEETFTATLDLARDLLERAPGCVEVNAFYMGPYPGTIIASMPEKFGLKTVDDRFMKGLTLSDVHMTTDFYDVKGIRSLKKRFFNEVERTMEALVPKIPRDMLGTHFQWAWNYGLSSLWYLYFLNRREALKNFFRYLESPRYAMFSEVPKDRLLHWHPQRVVETREYSPDGGSIILPDSTKKETLTDPLEILVYELSTGKLTVNRMLEEFIRETGTDRTPADLLENVFIPVFQKLDQLYQVVFFPV